MEVLITLFHVIKVLINSQLGDNIYLPILLSEGGFIILQLDIWNSIFTIFNIGFILLIIVGIISFVVILVRKLFKYLDVKTNYYNSKINNNSEDRQD